MPLFGAHMSISGGPARAVERIRRVGGRSLQIFSANQRQWRAAPLAPAAAQAFRRAVQEWGGWPVAIHNSYLVNLAASDPAVAEKSVAAMIGELERAHALGVTMVVIHPGAHTGGGVDAGIRRVAANLDRIFAAGPAGVDILLETTAGAGTTLGSDFVELARIIDRCRHPERLGVCFDTCHVFAAGYDLTEPGGYQATMAALDETVGLDRLRFFHLNDSRFPCGSRRDRHAHIGEGCIGRQGFANLLADPRFHEHPMVLETPKGEDLAEDTVNLAVLQEILAEVAS